MDYDDIDKIVFASDSAQRASVGEIKEEAHWQNVLKRVKGSEADVSVIKNEFFGGDVIDLDLVNFIRSLRGKFHTGLISNAWSGLRSVLEKEKLIDVFDTVIISAEVGMTKPELGIFRLALEQAKVKAEEAVFVDDVQVNIDGCQEVGMKGVLFDDPRKAMERLKELLKVG
jgi:epoxide hydrolase-like predicted phosphatase